ncbi:YdcF family protein [Exilibacterium tricleocarpae]|uniref:YdcF family protein n=1 Tax=Exilibacterium tricleocarpae TaxID=2591008 RepID=A0A545STH9_9GAMM|nr:YdcF family protein [Exilibacterium tricleocarpae]TQV68245.1 YdcF family protein [Exilibacterium tricleocarpae]
MIVRAILKALALPPGLNVLLLLLALACWWHYRRLSLALAAVSLVLLIALSLPRVAQVLAHQLERPYPAVSPEQVVRGAQAIVVLGGGDYPRAEEFGGADLLNAAALVRVRYAAYLQRRTGLPILVSGGRVYGHEREAQAEIMARSLRDHFGVDVEWIEPASRTTLENAIYSAEVLAAAGIERIALVSHALHMRRSVAVFSQRGLTVLPAPTGYFARTPIRGWLAFLPRADALDLSRRALHEQLGYWVYKLESQ